MDARQEAATAILTRVRQGYRDGRLYRRARWDVMDAFKPIWRRLFTNPQAPKSQVVRHDWTDRLSGRDDAPDPMFARRTFSRSSPAHAADPYVPPDADAVMDVREALLKLIPRHRAALEAHMAGESDVEHAARLGVTHAALRSLLVRARKAMRVLLRAYEDDEC